jgi:iron complex outermembrane receptor protein
MKVLIKTVLLAGAGWGAIAAPTWAQDAAEEAQARANVATDEVVVTARRREENLQDVPVAVSAYSETRLENLGARDITDLQRTTPSITVQTARGSNSTLISFIRGVGQQDPLWGFEPGVGLYVDDVYVARPQAAVLDIFDIQRIEVLRGPQGTLYGRNTVGGAIKYVTDRVGSEPEVKVRGQLGSYNQRDLLVMAESPLADTVGGSFAFASYNRDGFGKNRNTGAEHYNKDVTAARGTLEFTPRDDLFVRLSADYIQDDSNPRHGNRLQPLVVGTPPAVVPGTEPLSDPYDTFAGAGDDNKVTTGGASVTAEWEFNEALTFKSITAYRSGKTDGVIDFDATNVAYLDIPAKYRDVQFSQELQALYTGDRVQGVVGVYYLDAAAKGAFDTVLGPLNLTIATAGKVNTESLALFGDFSFDVTDALSMSVGGRWTRDEKTGYVFRQNFAGVRSRFFGNTASVPGLIRTNPTAYDGRTYAFEEFTPRVSATYEFSPALTAYASWSKGFKSGGIDMRGDAIFVPFTVEGYKPEFVETAEIGLKGSLLDRRLNFAVAAFDSAYTDMQITTQYPSTTGVASVVDNVGEASIRGFEFEGTLRATDALTFGASLSLLDAEFDKFLAYQPLGAGAGQTCASNPPRPVTAPGCFVDVSSTRRFQNTPEKSGSIYGTYTVDLAEGGSVAITPTASYRSDTQQFELPIALLDQPAYWLYDLAVVWRSGSGKYEAGLIGRNLSDERYIVGGYNFPGPVFGNSINAFYGNPRTWTASFQVKF